MINSFEFVLLFENINSEVSDNLLFSNNHKYEQLLNKNALYLYCSSIK